MANNSQNIWKLNKNQDPIYFDNLQIFILGSVKYSSIGEIYDSIYFENLKILEIQVYFQLQQNFKRK